MVRTFIARQVLKLVTKHGMKFVLQGLIEVCESQHEPYMVRLADDLTTALKNYEQGRKK
jgi:hypothetical protein